MNAQDMVRIIRADSDAYAEAFRVCAGTLWFRRDITGLTKVDDMLIVNQAAAGLSPAVLAGEGRAAAAAACGEALRGMAVSRAAREHGMGMHPPVSLTTRLLAAALDGVDWDAVGSKFLAATFAQLDYQDAREAAGLPRAA